MSVICESRGAPPLDRHEILRYAGVRGEAPPEISALLEECISDAEKAFVYSVCHAEFPCSFESERLDLGFTQTDSRDLSSVLIGCSSVLVFAATVGLGIDRLIRKYAGRSPAKSVLLQALGTERVEALCDAFCKEQAKSYAEKGLTLTKRFSPGYGDLPLSLQSALFCALDCRKHIGVTLTSDLLMTPQKSVTAIVGIRKA